MSLNFFRKIFNLDLSKKTSRKGRSRRLELLGLEERVVPATFTVVNNSDLGAGSLRDAITLANTTVGDDIIDFNFATGSSPYTITLASALPNIVDANSTVGTGTAGTVTITGLGSSSLTIDANKGNFSIFTINTGGDLSISGVTVSGANISGNGGGFNNKGTLTITNSTISGNVVSGIGQNLSGLGGGIHNDGTLTVNNSLISGNTATNGGGIYNRATLSLSNSTISGNYALASNSGSITSGNIYAGNGGGFTLLMVLSILPIPRFPETMPPTITPALLILIILETF